MTSIIDRAEASAAKLLDRVKIAVGSGCASINSVRDHDDYLEAAEHFTREAANNGWYPAATTQLLSASGAIGEVRKRVKQAAGICLDIRALREIQEALRILNNPQNMLPGSRAAAAAYGMLFVGLGRFVEKVPGLSIYAPIFTGCLDFFSSFQQACSPTGREGAAQFRGGQIEDFDKGE